MRRFNHNRVDVADDGVETRQSFELPERSAESGSYGRSRSVNNDGSGPEDPWSQAVHTVRRARSLHRNAHQSAINFLPSRHVTNVGALGNKIPGMDAPLLGDGGPETQENQVQQIVQQMEQVDTLMEDNPDAEEMRLETLRDLPQCLTVKRNIRRKITASVSRKSKDRPIGFFKRTKYRFGFWRKKVKQNFRNLIFSLELWYDSIKAIEGRFGSGVATYFRFLRWLFIMNACVSIFLISFIVIPQALYVSDGGISMQVASFSFVDIFSGQGSFTNSTLYYGYYSPEVISVIPGHYYNIPYAYFFTMLIMYFTMFVVLSIRMARSYRVSFIESTGGLKNVYANKIFCGWDFGISSPQAANLKSRILFNELKELLSDSSKIKCKLSTSETLMRLFIKILVHLFAATLLCLTGVLMVTLLDDNALNMPDVMANIKAMDYGILLAVIISLVMLIVPIIFSYISRFEHYNDPRTTIFITLFRTFALEVVVVAILVIFWLKSSNKCWETSLGQEVYRLIIFDFIISIIGMPIIEFLRTIITKYLWQRLGIPEFDIARNTLGLIYNQTLLWMGLFYSPILPAIVTLKMFITFYVKRLCIRYTCQPSSRSWRASQTQTFFLVLIFLSLLVILLTLGYIFTGVLTGGCGPFNSYNYVYLVFVDGILNLKEGSTFFTVIMYITKPGVVAFILIAMCVGAYYLRAKSLAQKSMVNILRDMLVLESKDKEFLLDAIAKVTKGHWVYSQKPSDSASNSLLESSSTWKYLKDTDRIRKPSNADYQFEVANSPKKNLYDSPRSSGTPMSPLDRPSSSGLQRNFDNSPRQFNYDTPRSLNQQAPQELNPTSLRRDYDSRNNPFESNSGARSSSPFNKSANSGLRRDYTPEKLNTPGLRRDYDNFNKSNSPKRH